MWSLLLNTEITYTILKNGVCYTEIQAARLEALTCTCVLKLSQLMQDGFGETALFAACSQGRLDAAAVLIKHGAMVNCLSKVRPLCVHGQHVW